MLTTTAESDCHPINNNNPALSIDYTIQTCIEMATSMTVVVDLRLAVQVHALILCLHNSLGMILLKPSVWNSKRIMTPCMILQQRQDEKAIINIVG